MMKKYVILTHSISGLSGNPRYVNNKVRLLKEQGWDVQVFWSHNVHEVELEYVKPFDDRCYIYHELDFFPCFFTKRQQKKIVSGIIRMIGPFDHLVIESNKIELGAWGEMIAQRLNVKHLNFVTSEGVTIRNKATFDYCYAKLQRDEFFNINVAAVMRWFSKFTTIEHPEDYYMSASQGVEVRDISFPAFENIPKADYTITHFGRKKPYLPSALDGLAAFVDAHPDKTFNIFFLGNGISKEEVANKLNARNVNLVFHDAVSIVPHCIFVKSDVIIGTAGCASLASANGGKVISMDVNTYKPLGIHRYTTMDSNTFSGRYPADKTLLELLESILISQNKYERLDTAVIPHTFEYQMGKVTSCDHRYLDTSRVEEDLTGGHNRLCKVLIKMGLFRVVESYYFRHFTHKITPPRQQHLIDRQLVVVEFNGLPGLGKTTVSNKLEQLVIGDGKTSIRRYHRHWWQKTIRPFFVIPWSMSLYHFVCRWSDSITPYRKRRIHRHWPLFFSRMYSNMVKDKVADYALIDEGIVQFLASVAGKDSFSQSKVLTAVMKKIWSKGIRFVRVDCSNDVATAVQRIQQRPNRGLAFDRMAAEELTTRLTTWATNLETLRKSCDKIFIGQQVITINMSDSAEYNAAYIYSQLKIQNT